jgi:hypothetical protein
MGVVMVRPEDQIACSLHLGVATSEGHWIECSPWCAGTRGLASVRSDMCGAVEPHLGAMCALARHSGNRHRGPKGEWQTWTS